MGSRQSQTSADDDEAGPRAQPTPMPEQSEVNKLPSPVSPSTAQQSQSRHVQLPSSVTLPPVSARNVVQVVSKPQKSSLFGEDLSPDTNATVSPNKSPSSSPTASTLTPSSPSKSPESLSLPPPNQQLQQRSTSPSQTSDFCYSDNEIDDNASDESSNNNTNANSSSGAPINSILSTLDRTPSLASMASSINSTSNNNPHMDDFLGLPLDMSLKTPTKSSPDSTTSSSTSSSSPPSSHDNHDLGRQILRSPRKQKSSGGTYEDSSNKWDAFVDEVNADAPVKSGNSNNNSDINDSDLIQVVDDADAMYPHNPNSDAPKPKPARPTMKVTVNFSDPKSKNYVTSSHPTHTSKHSSTRWGEGFSTHNPRPTSIRTQSLVPEGYDRKQWEYEVLAPQKAKKTPSFAAKFLKSKVGGAKMHLGGGKGGLDRLEKLSKKAVEDLDDQTGGIVTLMKKLRDKVSLDTTVQDLAIHLIDTSQALPVAQSDKMDFSRRVFVMLDGPELVVDLFSPQQGRKGADPFQGRDARDDLNKREVTLNSNFWNEALVLLRELSYLHPNIASDFISKHFLIYLFTMISHSCIFECTVGLIEEILSLLPPTNLFDVSEVPAFYDLLENLSCKQMGHFCRVMALLAFEPEDRVLMESSTALKSMSLLQLRRDRTSRGSTTIDKNQSVLLGMDDMLQRLVDLLKVLNYAPGLDRLTSYHVIAHVPSISALLVSIGVSEVESWDDLERMDKLARRGLNSAPPTTPSTTTTNAAAAVVSPPSPTLSSPGSASSPLASPASAQATPTETRLPSSLGSIAPMLESIAPHLDSGQWNMEIIVHSLNAAHRLNIIRERESPSSGATETGSALLRRLNMLAVDRRRTATTPSEAANDLQFTALLLAQYQVEVLFVLCTLLGGRRKLTVQKALSQCNLVSVLDSMFDRLSWGKVDTEAASQMGRIHGPGCECNPESALRVQYLRLLHNYCDRDCDNYEGKREMLSRDERRYLRLREGRECNWDWLDEPFEGEKGLLSKLIVVLMKEPNDSIYRFWLASAVEAYLRGATDVEQVYVARSGLLDHLTEEILSDRLRCAGSLQTSFDLLGELVKGNAAVLNMMVKGLDEESFERMMVVSTSNLVDSNVFIRSLMISLEREKYRKKERKRILKYGPQKVARSYLTHSWWDVEAIGVKGEDDQFDFNSDSDDDDDSDGDSDSDEARSKEGSPELEIHRKKNVNPNQIWIDDVNWYDDYEARNNNSNIQSRVRSASSVDFGSESDMWSTPSKSANGVGSWSESVIVSASASGIIGEEQEVEISSPSTEDLMTVGPTGWKFSPQSQSSRSSQVYVNELAFEPNTLSRIHWFLAANQTRLLRELMKVVSLHNVNHENICVLNTVIVFFIFINRKNEGNLERVLQELRDTELAEKAEGKLGSGEKAARDDGEDIAALDDLDNYDHVTTPNQSGIMCNFRELLFFWREYYSHRGRDRLSLEFSSHLRFAEWKNVVDLLCADDGSPCSLVPSKISLPRSPYSRAPRN
ncbi:hypothetical protein TrST_g12621 [Triparma strigata]|uniref:Uncharacterized protein n=1 Tax=Triparma strigata TaxID=1606541 RepID=A0A9W7BPU1_9STRA|nr:hypothetical protein TrST_g12621 [Triparma strigata]